LTIEINVEVSCGELIDKLTILSIKNEKITNEEKLKNIQHEFKVLNEISKNLKSLNPNEFDNFYKKLRKINLSLWDIEDEIRKFEKESNFGIEFIELARSVYITNDERFRIKNEINSFFSSGIVEEKDYEEY
jgi:hypothetical protein